jgi:hypothetical protein
MDRDVMAGAGGFAATGQNVFVLEARVGGGHVRIPVI